MEDYQLETDILKEADACIDKIYKKDPFEFKFLKDLLGEFKTKFPKVN
jgi:hypothetical protein